MTLKHFLPRFSLMVAANLALAGGTLVAQDGTPPAIHCPLSMLVTAEPGASSAVVNYQAEASDNLAGVSLRCSPLAGSEFPIGVTMVRCVAHDLAGNSAACSFTVRVMVKDEEAPIAYGRELVRMQGGPRPTYLVQLLGGDNRDPNPRLFVKDSASGLVAGPFRNGDRVRVTLAQGLPPSQRKLAGVVAGEIRLRGEPLVYGVDASGNVGQGCICRLR